MQQKKTKQNKTKTKQKILVKASVQIETEPSDIFYPMFWLPTEL